jgi:Family of unknown function (DUF6261)
MNLYQITPTELTYIECGQFIVRLLTDIEETKIDVTADPDIKEMHTILTAKSIHFNKALLKIRAKEESIALANLDIHRDKKLTTLRRMHAVAEYTDNEAEKKAYDILSIVLRKYERVEILNFEAETLAIDKLIEELNQPDTKPSTELLGMLPHMDNLVTSNTSFKTVFNSRSVKNISDEVFDTKNLKKEILASYREFANFSLTMANRRKTDYYINLLKVVNNGREYFATIIARRKGGNDTPPSTT